MKFTRQQRQGIMIWRLKLATMVDQAFPTDAADPKAETEAMQIALLEMAIASMRMLEDQTGTMTVLNQVMYDMFDAEDDPKHWRHEENSRMIEIYTKAVSESDKTRPARDQR